LWLKKACLIHWQLPFPESAPEITADSVYDADVTNLDVKNSKEQQRLVIFQDF